jgi:hypothetical protein
LEDILKDNTTISQLQTDHDNRLKLRFAKLKPVRLISFVSDRFIATQTSLV